MKKSATFRVEKETKNTVKFEEVAEGYPMVGSLYVQKGAFEGNIPQEITVTIETKDD